MAQSGPPILPPSGGAAQSVGKSLDLGVAQVQRVSAELQAVSQTLRLEAQVIRTNENGTVTLQTPRGEVDIRPPVQLQNGQTIQLRLEAGAPPSQARLSIPAQATVQPQAQNQPQPQPQATSQAQTPVQTQTGGTQIRADAPLQPSSTNQTQAPLPSQTNISLQAAQRFDIPPVPLGTSIPTQFIPLPIPPNITAVEVLLTTLFNAGNLSALPSGGATTPQPNPLSSLAQIAQTTLPPPIAEGIQNVQLLKAALVGRQFNPAPLQASLYGLRPTIQNLPVTNLSLPQPSTAISPLTILPNTDVVQPSVINTEKPINGIATILSSIVNGGTKSTPQIQPQLNTAQIFFTQTPGKILQVPSFPIATTTPTGQPASLFFGVTLGQTPVGDFAVLGTNGIAILPQKSVTGPLLPGTVLVAQGQGITSQPNIGAFNIPTVNIQSALFTFDPIFGDSWPVLDEVLDVLQQINPAYAASVRGSIPNASNPAQLPTAILFFMAATGIGDIRAWLGEKAFDNLLQAGRSELSTLLGRDFSAIAARSSEQTPDGWRPFMVPMFFGETLHRMQFFTRHQYEENEDGSRGAKQTRFLVNVDQTKLGPLQLDGLVNEKRLDMVLRSGEMLGQNIRQGIRQHYSGALRNADMAGAINFEHGDKKWIEPDTAPIIDQSVFI